jgi:UDPglucose 6-dehydrogenase
VGLDHAHADGDRRLMRVSVIGTGYVGLVSGAGLCEKGHEVVCVDTDTAKVETIAAAKAPFHEPGLDALLARHVGRRLSATTDVHAAVVGSEITLLAIGTPFDGRNIDLTYVR